MPLIVKEYQATPNPNALKCVVDRPIAPLPVATGLRSYTSRDAAAADPLAAALFALEGVRNVLIHAPAATSPAREPGWISINKSPEVPWSALKPAIERVLRDQP